MDKLLVIGEASVHISNFVRIAKASFKQLSFIGEKPIEEPLVTSQALVSFRSKNPFSFLKNLLRLKRLIKQENADVIHLQQINRLAFVASLVISKNQKLAVTAWGSDVLLVPKRNIISKKMVQYVLNKAHCITADSDDMLQAIYDLGIDKNKCHKLFFGVAPIGIGIKEKIVYSNRLHRPLYKIDEVINYFAIFYKNHPDWKLIIGATGPETDTLKALVTSLKLNNAVDFVGWLQANDNRENYKKASLYISIPESDGTAVSLLEAMSAGCIPVVRDLPVAKEWLQDGITGVIIKQGEENPLERALNIASDEVRTQNEQTILQQATKDIAEAKLASLYQKLM